MSRQQDAQDRRDAAEWIEIALWDWLHLGTSGHVLHALGVLDDPIQTGWEWRGTGTTACGRYGWLSIPGILSRDPHGGVPRCASCCRQTGMPGGLGSPKNSDACRRLVEAQLARDGAYWRREIAAALAVLAEEAP